MCGRFTLIRPRAEIAETFGVDVPAVDPRYNIAPTQQVLVIKQEDSRVAALMRWGLVPSWSSSPREGPPLINARAETVEEKPAFRAAFRKRRCLVPADGFFEWKAEGRDKRPHYFTRSDGSLFAFAALWERWQGEAGVIESVAVLTTEANELVRPCHDRMPVILGRDAQLLWLDNGAGCDAAALRELLRPYSASEMTVRLAGKAVGSPKNEGPQCLDPADPAQATLF